MKISFSTTIQNETLVLVKNNENVYGLDQFDKLCKINNFKGQENDACFISSDKNYWFLGFDQCDNFIDLGAFAYKIFLNKQISKLSIDLSRLGKQEMKDFLSGFLLRSYNFNKYKKNTQNIIKELFIISGETLDSGEMNSLMFEIDSIDTAKSWINSAPCDIYPLQLAEEIKNYLEPLNIKVKILTREDVYKFPLLYAVGKASVNEPCVLVMEYNINSDKILALAGKGVTYDTGGLSLKPSNHMVNMKSDMSAAAVVASVMANAAYNKYEHGLVGIIGLVENSVAGNAYRPDDVLISYNNKSVEITNTDAEGRLVLADIISYIQEKYKIDAMIDLATLTGAVGVALGDSYAALFANDKRLAQQLIKAGQHTKELLHLLPMHKDYENAMKSQIADIKNCCLNGLAGTATAAAFLKFFVNENIKWAHLDIASVSYLKKEKFANEFGATGFGIRLINEFLKSFNFE